MTTPMPPLTIGDGFVTGRARRNATFCDEKFRSRSGHDRMLKSG